MDYSIRDLATAPLKSGDCLVDDTEHAQSIVYPPAQPRPLYVRAGRPELVIPNGNGVDVWASVGTRTDLHGCGVQLMGGSHNLFGSYGEAAGRSRGTARNCRPSLTVTGEAVFDIEDDPTGPPSQIVLGGAGTVHAIRGQPRIRCSGGLSRCRLDAAADSIVEFGLERGSLFGAVIVLRERATAPNLTVGSYPDHNFALDLRDHARARLNVLGGSRVRGRVQDSAALTVDARSVRGIAVELEAFDSAILDVGTGVSVLAHGGRITARGSAKVVLAEDFTGELLELSNDVVVRDRRAVTTR